MFLIPERAALSLRKQRIDSQDLAKTTTALMATLTFACCQIS